jgi:hypothetical protein
MARDAQLGIKRALLSFTNKATGRKEKFMAVHRTKRDILQEMLDEIGTGWIVIKPSADAPDSLDDFCKFQKPEQCLSVSTRLQWTHFQYPAAWPKIKEQIQQKIEVAKSKRV